MAHSQSHDGIKGKAQFGSETCHQTRKPSFPNSDEVLGAEGPDTRKLGIEATMFWVSWSQEWLHACPGDGVGTVSCKKQKFLKNFKKQCFEKSDS